MIAEILNPQGKVSYRRPIPHKDIAEALQTKGYKVRLPPGSTVDALQLPNPENLTVSHDSENNVIIAAPKQDKTYVLHQQLLQTHSPNSNQKTKDNYQTP
jgi:hypothetical protein